MDYSEPFKKFMDKKKPLYKLMDSTETFSQVNGSLVHLTLSYTYPVTGSTTWTFETWSGASIDKIPPVCPSPCLMCFLTWNNNSSDVYGIPDEHEDITRQRQWKRRLLSAVNSTQNKQAKLQHMFNKYTMILEILEKYSFSILLWVFITADSTSQINWPTL